LRNPSEARETRLFTYAPAHDLLDEVNIRIRPDPGRLPKVAELARSILEVVECHRITGEDCFILKAHFPAIDQLDRLLDQFLVYGATTTSIVQSTPVPLRLPPLPNQE
jgi:Lrp/AsnC family leucine-responsive transcriptional regulator